MIRPHVFGTILDYGCGTGRIARAVGAIGYDPDPEVIAYAQSLGGQFTITRPEHFDSAYSVLVFQHLPDDEVREIIEYVQPRPFRFQFVVGSERGPYSYQRTEAEMLGLCDGYQATIDDDPVYPQWRWVTCR